MATTLHQFLHLPHQLQLRIWQQALPGDITAALYTWQPGCWCPAHRAPTDADYRQPRDGDLNLVVDFCHDRLGYTQIDVPMAAVSADARAVAYAWAATQGVQVLPAPGGRPMFVRRFHPRRDILYVPPADWNEFIREPERLPFEIPLFSNQFYALRTQIRRVAVSEAAFQQPASMTNRMLWQLHLSHPRIKTLYVVSGRQPDARRPSMDGAGESVVPWRTGVEAAQGWELTWFSDHKGVQQGYSFLRSIPSAHRIANHDLRVGLTRASILFLHDYAKHIPRPLRGIISSHTFHIRAAYIDEVQG